jgi:hypothetical protein
MLHLKLKASSILIYNISADGAGSLSFPRHKAAGSFTLRLLSQKSCVICLKSAPYEMSETLLWSSDVGCLYTSSPKPDFDEDQKCTQRIDCKQVIALQI